MAATSRHRFTIVSALMTLCLASAWAAPAQAQAPGSDKAADKAEKRADKAEKRADKAEDKADKRAEIAQRRKTQRDAARIKLTAGLKGQPMPEAMKQELKLHARRSARLEQIAITAREAKDTASAERAQKLIEKENARHDKHMAALDTHAAPNGAVK